MMATEATSENLATLSTIPNHELSTTESSSNDVSSEHLEPLLNGTAEIDGSRQDISENVESGVASLDASINGGSDTEASKTDANKIEDEEKGYVRTASTVKKFASFKPVSVNKKFLAAKGPAAAATSKVGETAAGATTAQAGSSASATLRPRLVAKLGSGLRDSSPRNSAAAGGGVPGAAPDASAVWNKNRPAPPAEPKRMTDEELKQQYGIHLATRLESDAPGRQANWADIDDDDEDWAPETIEWGDGTKVALPSADDPPAREPSPIPVVEPPPVSLEVAKPRSPAPSQASTSPAVKPSGFGGRAGLVLKGASEKPTLIAKPPGPPTPIKSPWASLPPLDKAAPVVTDVPNQHPQPGRFAQRDPHGFHGMPPPPAKEIAADDFSRAGWRENSANTSKELYNSQSGRYEPVHERRGHKNDGSRQPAVLQRPAPSDGPAEPSPAFQTHHNSQNASFGRRRTSSNVSGGSGNLTRRMSRSHDMPPPHELLGARRGSLAAVNDMPSPRNFSPSGHGHLPRQTPQHQSRSPVVSHPSPNSIHGQPLQPSQQPEPTTVENKTPVVYEDPVEYQKREMKEKRELAIKRRQEEEAQEEAARKERIRLKLEAMGPAPEKKKDKKDEKPAPTQIQAREVAPTPEVKADVKTTKPEVVEQQPTSTAEVKSMDQLPNKDMRPNGMSGGHVVPNAPISKDNRPAQTWQAKSSSAWAPPPAPQSSSNVWGPPSNIKATLGNGTFNPELSASARPGPLGAANRGNGQYQQGRGRGMDPSRIAPIGPPSRQLGSQGQQQPRKMAPGWGELPEQLAREDALAVKEAEAERARREELEQNGLLVEASQPTYQEVWHQVNINPDGTRSKIQAKVKSTVNDSSAPQIVQEEAAPQPALDSRRTIDSNPVRSDHLPHSQITDSWKGVQSPMGRTSRFFNNNRDVRLEEQNGSFGRPASPSPPPPTMEGHPAYDGGNIKHPQINFPKPAPVVRLPPVAVPLPTPIGPPKQPLSFASVVTAPTQTPAQRRLAGSQDVRREAPVPSGSVGGSQWKEKINGLFPKNMVVDSATKHSLSLGGETTVSLPSSVSGDLAQDDASVTSKPASTRCFEEPQMGSLPIVKVPTKAPANAWSLSPAPKTNHAVLSARDVTSTGTFVFEMEKPAADENAPHGSHKVSIKLPGQEEAVKVNHSPRNSRGGRGRGSNRGYRGGRGGRGGVPGGSSSPAPAITTPTQPNRGRRQNRGAHRGGNGRGDHTSSSWVNHQQQPATAS